MENEAMAKRGKNYRKVLEDIDTSKMYSLEEGVDIL